MVPLGPVDKILLHLQARKMNSDEIDWELFCIDGSVIRCTSRRRGRRKKNPPAREPEDHALGRSQGGFGTKLHLICDGEGTPIAVAVGPGQEHETQQAIPLLRKRRPGRSSPRRWRGIRGTRPAGSREWLRERGIEPVIAHHKNEKARQGKFDKKTYRRRNIIERCINSLKWFRRVATRYEKLATHYLAMVTLAIIFRLLG